MNYLKFLLVITGIIMSLQKMNSQDNFEWNLQKKIERKNNREDSTKWDSKIIEIDSLGFSEGENFGFFPTPDYDLIGRNSFDGLGYGGSFDGIVVNNRTFVYNDFYVLKCLTNDTYIGNRENEVFFVIIVMTDFIDTVDYSHMEANVISRNHPDYLANGCIKTKTNKIDYTAFITGDRREYAIVNSRIFDLDIGRIILFVPSVKVPGMLLSKQIDIPISSNNEIKEIVPKILKDKEIVAFYNNDN
jgi:hypothetical protein